MEEYERKDETKGFTGKALVFSSLLGSIIGGAVAALYSPWDGRRTRGKIKEWTDEAKEKAQKLSENLKGKASKLMEKQGGGLDPPVTSASNVEEKSVADHNKEIIC